MDDEIAIEGGAPVRIPPEQYAAELLSSRRADRFGRHMLHMRFRIVTLGPYQGIELDAWVPLGDGGKARRGSKLVRWFMSLSLPDSKWHKVRMKAFKDHLLMVQVRTVERDHNQQLLPECHRYSVIDQVIGQVGRIGGRAHQAEPPQA